MNIVFRLLVFFQEEDGIRDTSVTGVQTCALPISAERERARMCCTVPRLPRSGHHGQVCLVRQAPSHQLQLVTGAGLVVDNEGVEGVDEIGRASCRERKERWSRATKGKRREQDEKR